MLEMQLIVYEDIRLCTLRSNTRQSWSYVTILYRCGIHYENKITPDCKVTDSCSDVMVVNDCDDCVMIRRTDSGIIHITTNAFISISS